MTPEERAAECFAGSTDPWKWDTKYVPVDIEARIAAAIREAEKDAVKRCVQSVRDYADGIQIGIEDGGGVSPLAVEAARVALDIADMLEGKK